MCLLSTAIIGIGTICYFILSFQARHPCLLRIKRIMIMPAARKMMAASVIGENVRYFRKTPPDDSPKTEGRPQGCHSSPRYRHCPAEIRKRKGRGVFGFTEKNTPFEPIYFPMYSLFSPFSRTLIHILI